MSSPGKNAKPFAADAINRVLQATPARAPTLDLPVPAAMSSFPAGSLQPASNFMASNYSSSLQSLPGLTSRTRQLSTSDLLATPNSAYALPNTRISNIDELQVIAHTAARDDALKALQENQAREALLNQHLQRAAVNLRYGMPHSNLLPPTYAYQQQPPQPPPPPPPPFQLSHQLPHQLPHQLSHQPLHQLPRPLSHQLFPQLSYQLRAQLTSQLSAASLPLQAPVPTPSTGVGGLLPANALLAAFRNQSSQSSLLSSAAPAHQQPSLGLATGSFPIAASMPAVRTKLREEKRQRSRISDPFPVKLHRLLRDMDSQGKQGIVSFSESGKSFKVHKQDQFVSEIAPMYFRQKYFSSFTRQLNVYGFDKVIGGPDRGAFYHPQFQRDNPELAKNILAKAPEDYRSHGRLP